MKFDFKRKHAIIKLAQKEAVIGEPVDRPMEGHPRHIHDSPFSEAHLKNAGDSQNETSLRRARCGQCRVSDKGLLTVDSRELVLQNKLASAKSLPSCLA